MTAPTDGQREELALPGQHAGPRGDVGRRTFLKGAGVAAFGVGSLAVLPLLGTSSATQDPRKCTTKDLSETDPSLVISNWPEYIDEDSPTTLEEFEKQSGVSVRYTADVNDNIEFFAKVRNQLGACQPSGRDMFMLTDWMAARMIDAGWIQPLEASNVATMHENIIDSLASPGWDKDRSYSAPWQSGMTGIAYNKSRVKEVRSFSELMTRPDLKGKVSLLSEMRDTMGFMLMMNDADPSDFTQSQWETATETLRKSLSDGQIRSIGGNEYVQDLAAGNVVACEAWSGDVAAAEDENLVFVSPEEGLMIWADNMLIPNLAPHKANAEKWIDFYYDPKIAAQLADYVYYICPVKGADTEMEKLDPDLMKNDTLRNLIFPDFDDTKVFPKKPYTFMALDEVKSRAYEGDFADVTGG